MAQVLEIFPWGGKGPVDPTMAADALATQVAMASAAMVLT